MKRLKLYSSAIFIFIATSVFGQDKFTAPDTSKASLDSLKVETAKAMALDYVRLILKGNNMDSLTTICSVPFSWDRKRIIDNKVDLKASFQSIIDNKGKDRAYEIDTVLVYASRHEMLDDIIPIYIYYTVVGIKVEKNGKEQKHYIEFAIQISDEPRIIGFSD